MFNRKNADGAHGKVEKETFGLYLHNQERIVDLLGGSNFGSEQEICEYNTLTIVFDVMAPLPVILPLEH